MTNLNSRQTAIKLLLFCILLCLSELLASQHLYVSTNQNFIYRIDSAYSLTFITSVTYPKTLTDIAISSQGKMYGIASGDLMEINLENGDVEFLFKLPGRDYSTSLVCSHDDRLYFRGVSSHVLYAFD